MTNHKIARTVRTVRIALLAFAGLFGVVPASAGPLLDAARRDNVQRVEQIVHSGSGADVDDQGPQGDMPLHWAAFQGSTIVVEHLIAGGADVNARNRPYSHSIVNKPKKSCNIGDLYLVITSKP